MRKRIVQARERVNMSRADVGRTLNIPYRTITNYENGQREPGHDFLVRLADLCGVTTDWILGRADDPRGVAGSHVARDTEQTARLLTVCKALAPHAVERVITYAEDLTYNPANRIDTLTRADLHAELDRQLDAQKETPASQVS